MQTMPARVIPTSGFLQPEKRCEGEDSALSRVPLQGILADNTGLAYIEWYRVAGTCFASRSGTLVSEVSPFGRSRPGDVAGLPGAASG